MTAATMKQIRETLNGWLSFAADVQASDCAGEDWLESARGATVQALAALKAEVEERIKEAQP